MKIGTYISELLFDHEQVTLPGFGEFSTKYIPARFIPEEKKIESPSKVISFDAAKKEGDTPLIVHMASKEHKEVDQVKKFIDDFVSEIKETLASGQKVELERVGIFSLDAEGNVAFEADKSINYLADSAGLGAISEPTRVSPPPVAPPPPVPEEPVFVEPPAPEPIIEEAQPEFEEEVVETPPATEPIPEPDEETPAPIAPVAAAQEPVKQDLPPAIKWLAWVIIPLLVILIILAFNWNFIFGKKSQTPAARPQTETAAPAPAASQPAEMPAETTESAETAVAAPVATTPQTTAAAPARPEAGRKVYHIVVGAFQDEGQANRFVEELKGKGASQASVFMRTSSGFHRVSYAFFYDLAEAEAALPRVQQDINSTAWILHR
ncbi:MAG: SPOR domain-containing protein [Bacteroidales bacterium]|nr:SPOR domain-containing protein [Bacteroidales bacterium]